MQTADADRKSADEGISGRSRLGLIRGRRTERGPVGNPAARDAQNTDRAGLRASGRLGRVGAPAIQPRRIVSSYFRRRDGQQLPGRVGRTGPQRQSQSNQGL